MRLRRATATTLLTVLTPAVTLTGCSDGDDPDGSAEPTSTWSPTGTMEQPSTSPASAHPTEPVLPAAATERTEAGARAFIQHYWDLVNYAQVTGDVTRLSATSGPDCSACQAFIDRVRVHYRGGGRIVGGSNEVTVLGAAKLSTPTKAAFGYEVSMDVTHDEQVIETADGKRDIRGPGTDRFTAYLLWIERSRWRLDVLAVE